MSEVRFYLDENVANAVAEGLRNRGIDVLTTHEASKRGTTDDEQIAYALEEGRVIVTQDDDLLSIASNKDEHAGIVYYKPQTRTIKQILRGLILIYDVLESDDMHNHVEYL